MASLAWTTITGGAASLNHHYSGTRRTKTFSKPPPSPETLAAIQAIQCVRYSPISTTESPRFRSDEPRKGADVLIETLEHEGVTDVFAYPGGASMEIHQALTRSATIRNHLLRHEQGEIFAAEGYARSTGRPGVCIATSGPGATNLVSGLADALLDSIPLVAITGQVPRRMIGTDAFQETPIVEVTRSISKHNYLVLDADDIPRVVREAFFLSTSGRPGPVLVDIPKDIQQQLVIPCWNSPLRFYGYISRLPKPPKRHFIEQLLRLLSGSRRPVIYAGGGCSNAASALRRFADLAGIPVASTLMGLGIFPTDGDLSLKMLGMPVDGCDLLLAFGVQFDKLEAFANRAKIVHVDIDPAGIGKNKSPHLSVCADVRQSLEALNNAILETGLDKKLNFSAWREELDQDRSAHPLSYKVESTEAIPPQHAIELLDELTSGEAIISTGDGHHQMWAAQYYTYRRPHQWLSSAGFGAMGFGLPAAAGAAVGNPGVTVVDIDGDRSFLMNVQELAMIRIENLPVKIMVLNNQQHLGMDGFYKYLGDGHSKETEVYPDLVAIAKGFNVPGARVTKRSLLRGAMREMLDTPGPYLLDVIVPSGATFKDLTTE